MAYARRGYHDIGGDLTHARAVPPKTEPPPDWAHLTDAIRTALGVKYRLHEQRRKIEELGQNIYDKVTYYEIRVLAMLEVAVEKGYLTKEQVQGRMKEITMRGKRDDARL